MIRTRASGDRANSTHAAALEAIARRSSAVPEILMGTINGPDQGRQPPSEWRTVGDQGRTSSGVSRDHQCYPV